jgi:hypothetical protein
MGCYTPSATRNSRLRDVSYGLTSFIYECWLMIPSYLTFDIVIRICIELRLHVPVGFAAIEIPSKTFLVVADLLLLLLVVSTNESMIMRLEVDHGFRYTLHICVVGLSCSAVVLLGIAERAYAIVAGVKWGFAWDKPDWINYAIVRLAYSSVYLGLALFSFAAALVVLRIRNRISRQTSYVDLCGKVCYALPACHWNGANLFEQRFHHTPPRS